MAEIVNLNKVRKAKARTGKAVQADINRVKYGRTKAEKENDRRAAERREQLHRGHRLDDKEGD